VLQSASRGSDSHDMADVSTRSAGEFADRRFRERRRAWRRRIWWAFPLGAVLVLGIAVFVGFVFAHSVLAFYVGFGCGAALALVVAFIDSPPQHVERWRRGAEGERRSVRALRRLLRRGWRIVNDLDTGRGNIDHVLVGPAGVFVLETKNLSGDASVKHGVLRIRWREDPDDGYELPQVARTVRWRSRMVADHLEASGLGRISVQPAVVLWAGFDQGSVLSEGVAWIRGGLLAEVLGRRPQILTQDQVNRVGVVLAAWHSRNAASLELAA
jgi:hypothetical protein